MHCPHSHTPHAPITHVFVGAVTIDVEEWNGWPQPLFVSTYAFKSYNEADDKHYFMPVVWTKPLTRFGKPCLQMVWLAPLEVGTGAAKETLWVIQKGLEQLIDLDDMEEELEIKILVVDNGIFRLDLPMLVTTNEHGETCLQPEIVVRTGI